MIPQPTPSPYAVSLYERLLRSVPSAVDGRPTWRVAAPYLLRHAAQHAANAGRAGELLEDSEFLVHGEPSAVNSILGRAASDSARLAAAVYRTSYGIHRGLEPFDRRQVLALDAARFHAAQLAEVFAREGDWKPLWATGSQVSAGSTAILTG
ncbi:hypothetical protein ACFW89_33415, partial [Streptomyces albidoflavus]